MNVNKLIFAGNLTRDPEMRASPGGVTIAKFTLANNYKVKDRETVTFLDCVAFNKAAETIATHFSKGKRMLVEARLSQSNWEDKDGNKRSKIEAIVDQFHFVDRKSEEPAAPAHRHREDPRDNNDELPPF